MPAETPQSLRAPKPQPLRVLDIQLYRVSEDLTEGLIYFMLVFSPWAFGTTQPWSISIMDCSGYILGILLLIKLILRSWKNYQLPRWQERGQPCPPEGDSKPEMGGQGSPRPNLASLFLSPSGLTVVLASLTILILLFCLVSALNARATFHPGNPVPEYHQRPAWMLRFLPSSMDSSASWRVFWNYLALALSFWAIRDWLLGKSGPERLPSVPSTPDTRHSTPQLLPARMRRLLWVLSICGGLLALESIIQRAAGLSKLLFLVQPRVNPNTETQFGPFAYRANAAQYFNLLWPVTLAFWWTLQRAGRHGSHHVLLFCCALMAAGPIISTSRAGAFITAAILILTVLLLFAWPLLFPEAASVRRKSRASLRLVLLCGIAAIILGFALGWKNLKPRLAGMEESFAGREQMYEAARPMSRDYHLFGTGPGTFESVFQLYRISTETYWPAQLHNDWLETRITFGWLGTILILAALLTVLTRWFIRGGIHGGRRFMLLILLALVGCLVHARYDFPFQIYSILFLFLTICALLFNLSRRPW